MGSSFFNPSRFPFVRLSVLPTSSRLLLRAQQKSWLRRSAQTGLFCLSALTLSCMDHRDPPVLESANQRRVQAAVDSVRHTLEDRLKAFVPSMNVLIQTPTQTYFVSSVAPGRQLLTPNTFFRFASNTKNFTATTILTMYQDGWLDYKAPEKPENGSIAGIMV